MELEEQIGGFWPRSDTPADAFLFEQGAVMRAAKAAFQRRVGISEARLHVLGTLFVLGEQSQAQLQRHLVVDAAAVTRQVKQLEVEGLISRRVDPADNRFTLVSLTAEGMETLREAAQKVKGFLTQSLDGVSAAELSCMQHAMARIRENLENM